MAYTITHTAIYSTEELKSYQAFDVNFLGGFSKMFGGNFYLRQLYYSTGGEAYW